MEAVNKYKNNKTVTLHVTQALQFLLSYHQSLMPTNQTSLHLFQLKGFFLFVLKKILFLPGLIAKFLIVSSVSLIFWLFLDLSHTSLPI